MRPKNRLSDLAAKRSRTEGLGQKPTGTGLFRLKCVASCRLRIFALLEIGLPGDSPDRLDRFMDFWVELK